MDNAQILSWIVGAVGIFGFLLAGRKVWWSWYVNIVCQVFWVLYALASNTPAFLITAFFYTAVFGYNAYKWTKEHRGYAGFRKATKENDSGTYELPSGVKVTYYTIEEDTNLMRHARAELEGIGEEPAIIEQYLKIIRAFSEMGHSGSSAQHATATLERLLRFKPLSPITNNDEEWYFHGADVWGEAGGVWQNKRDGRMFSKDGGLTYTNVDDPKDPEGNKPVYCSMITDNYV